MLLDENPPWTLGPLLTGHEHDTVVRMGWGGIKNGKLLALAEKHFDVFLSVDRGLPFEQNLPKFDLAVFLLRARSNLLPDLRPLVPSILIAAQQPKKRALTIIEV